MVVLRIRVKWWDFSVFFAIFVCVAILGCAILELILFTDTRYLGVCVNFTGSVLIVCPLVLFYYERFLFLIFIVIQFSC